MTNLTRPELDDVPEDVIAYIEALERELAARSPRRATARSAGTDTDQTDDGEDYPLEPDEEPTTINVISISGKGIAKRTPRHLYARQRRSGMGIFDLDAPDGDAPRFLVTADESATLLLITNQGRAFRASVREIVETPVRGRGQSIIDKLPLRADERLAVVIPDQGGSFLNLVSERGQVRRLAAQFVGRNMVAGTVLHDPRDGGAVAAACWSRGTDELLIVTRQGRAIRFAERLVPVRGCLGLRVEQGDSVYAYAAAPADGAVFLLGADGKGTIRLLEGFSANKSPGSGGKTLMKTDALVAALQVDPAQDDLFLISELGKIIRFRANQIPPKEGVVQGVHCMSLRADTCCAAASSPAA